MALTMGVRLGHYEILTQIGRGGMGEVYHGRDLNLDRDVAIKVLPAAVAENATRRARFEREAHVISQLSHPNICAIYDVGEQDGVAYLVMEYIDGDTLEQRLRAGALPWTTSLQIATEIASALAHAHEHGIVHRDLKPANVMVSGSAIKLLDFGIAKLIDEDVISIETRTVSLTGDHRIVGTPNYMSPEQLEGRSVDGRADIFALGALLYEMVTGRKAFEGASVASVTAAVIKTEPPPISSMTAEGPIAPAALEHVVRRALAKPPDERWQTAQDLEHELRWVGENSLHEPSQSRSTALGWRLAALAAVAALALILGAWTGWKLGGPLVVPVGAKEVTSFTIEAPEGTQFGTGIGKVAVSPDGTMIAFVATTNGRPSVWIRELDSRESRRLAETEGAKSPFWSPDNKSLGFFADEATVIKRVDVAGGPARVITTLEREGPLGHEISACWMPDDAIVYTLNDGFYRVPLAGGTAKPFIGREQQNFVLLYSPFPLAADQLIYRAKLPSGEYESRVGGPNGYTTLPTVKSNAVLAAGYLVFYDGTRLLAQPMDASRREFAGQPIEIGPDVEHNPTHRANFSASDDVLAYFPEATQALTWIDRFGHRGGKVGEPGRDTLAALARDGTNRVALLRTDPGAPEKRQIVILDDQGHERPLSHDSTATVPVWSPDGRWIAYVRPVPSGAPLAVEFHRASPSGAGSDRLIAQFEDQAVPLDWSPDDSLIYTYKNDVWKVSLADGKKSQLTTSGKAYKTARLSNDGRWLAYTLIDKDGRTNWVQPFPAGTTPTRVPGNGYDPGWSPDGHELYYMTDDGSLMAVPMSVSADALPVFGTPVALFHISPTSASLNLHVFTVAPDGKFVVRDTLPSSTRINVIVNWTSRLKQ